jgi:hypothetical protein
MPGVQYLSNPKPVWSFKDRTASDKLLSFSRKAGKRRKQFNFTKKGRRGSRERGSNVEMARW